MPTATIHRQPGSELETTDEPRPLDLFIATPCYGGLMYMEHVHGVTLLRSSLYKAGVKHRWYPLGNESLITRARNRCVAEFLKGPHTDLLFIDADVGFKPEHVAMLSNSPYDIVCGAYPMKSIQWRAIAQASARGVPPHLLEEATAAYAVNMPLEAQKTGRCEVLENGGRRFVEVQDAATGFLLIRRHVIEKFIEHYGDEIRYVADYAPYQGEIHHAVFADGRDPLAVKAGEMPRWLSEDYLFSRMCQAIGFKIHLCIDVQLTHSGTYTWRGDVARIFGVGEPVSEQEQAAANTNASEAKGA